MMRFALVIAALIAYRARPLRAKRAAYDGTMWRSQGKCRNSKIATSSFYCGLGLSALTVAKRVTPFLAGC
jgi:hypothetical protein